MNNETNITAGPELTPHATAEYYRKRLAQSWDKQSPVTKDAAVDCLCDVLLGERVPFDLVVGDFRLDADAKITRANCRGLAEALWDHGYRAHDHHALHAKLGANLEARLISLRHAITTWHANPSRRLEARWAIYDSDGAGCYHGSFPTRGSASDYVDSLDSTEGWISKPAFIRFR